MLSPPFVCGDGIGVWFVGVVVAVLVGCFAVGCQFSAFGFVCGAAMMRLRACSVAWSRALASIVSDGSPSWKAFPPIASLMVLFVLGLTALIFHPVLLSMLAVQAPSDCMKMFVSWFKTSTMASNKAFAASWSPLSSANLILFGTRVSTSCQPQSTAATACTNELLLLAAIDVVLPV